MDEEKELFGADEIQKRFKKLFGRDMTRREREEFFLPLPPAENPVSDD
jgi:hypothetical protein